VHPQAALAGAPDAMPGALVACDILTADSGCPIRPFASWAFASYQRLLLKGGGGR